MAITKYKLNDWALIGDAGRKMCLIGKVEGHPTREDGITIVTSSIVGQTEGGLIVTGSGSHIELGNTKADYEANFPKAKQRLLASARILIEGI